MSIVEQAELAVGGSGRHEYPAEAARGNELGAGERNERVAQPLGQVHGQHLRLHLVAVDAVKAEQAIAIAHELRDYSNSSLQRISEEHPFQDTV